LKKNTFPHPKRSNARVTGKKPQEKFHENQDPCLSAGNFLVKKKVGKKYWRLWHLKNPPLN